MKDELSKDVIFCLCGNNVVKVRDRMYSAFVFGLNPPNQNRLTNAFIKYLVLYPRKKINYLVPHAPYQKLVA